MNRSASFAAVFVAVAALLSIAGMFMTSFSSFMHMSLVKETRSRNTMSLSMMMEGGDPAANNMGSLPDGNSGLAVTEQQADELTELMRALQKNPNDADALRTIGDIFIAVQEWSRAEAFLKRAVLSRPGDVRPRYMLGISQYQQNNFEAAAATFTELLHIREDPAAMYNLAVIYKYHAGKKAEAAELFQKIVNSPEADADTIGKAKHELE